MSQRYLGGIITANPTAPTLSSASGVWTLEQQLQYSQSIQPKVIPKSVRLRSSASAYFNRTPASAGSSTKMTISMWVKRGLLTSNNFDMMTSGASGSNDALRFTSGDILQFWFAGATYYVQTTAVFRDPSAWYHIVASADTTQATAANRMILYVNGVQQTAVSAVYPAQNYAIPNFNKAQLQYIGYNTTGYYLDGYLTEINFIDGQALTPSSFGAYDSNGVWQPLGYTGTYGTNGFYLNFTDNSAATATTLGKDYSGNGNNWTPNNISVTAGTTYDSMLDSPTNFNDGTSYGVGNYAVMNFLDKNASGTMAEGNLKWTAGAAQVCTRGSFAIPASGKFYMECLVGTASSATVGISFGLAASTVALDTSSGATNLYQIYASTNRQINLNNSTTGSLSGGFSANDILQIAVDVDNQKMWLGVNNTWYDSAFTGNGDPVAGTNATSTTSMVGFFPFSNCYQNSAYWNFGQRPFSYTPPTGFKALNTQNLALAAPPTITNGAKYMAATLWSGTGAVQTINNGANNTIGTTFQPDFAWIKGRNNATDHQFVDAVRGTSLYLSSNLTSAEATNVTAVTAFNSNGLALGTNSNTSQRVNYSGDTYVGWQWKAGAGTTSSIAAGQYSTGPNVPLVTSTVSVNTTAGFSVVTYTATAADPITVGHGLGVAPSMFFVKSRSAAGTDWFCYHSSLGATKNLRLNTTAAAATATNVWNNTAPTSTVITTSNAINTNTQTYVAYCFAAVAGYSAFGSYTGNGTTTGDGPFVYLGFRPRYVMLKNASVAGTNWYVYDSARNAYNQMGVELYPNASSAEASRVALDFTSNGFKIRSTASGWDNNNSGNTIIYAAFAENPFTIARAR